MFGLYLDKSGFVLMGGLTSLFSVFDWWIGAETVVWVGVGPFWVGGFDWFVGRFEVLFWFAWEVVGFISFLSLNELDGESFASTCSLEFLDSEFGLDLLFFPDFLMDSLAKFQPSSVENWKGGSSVGVRLGSAKSSKEFWVLMGELFVLIGGGGL